MMIIVRLSGGLGNQLFQYAFGKSLAIEQGCELLLDLRLLERFPIHDGYILNKFNIEAEVAQEKNLLRFAEWKLRVANKICNYINPLFNVYTEKSFSYHELPKLANQDMLFQGYWQADKYFKRHRDKIKESLSFKKEFINVNNSLVIDIDSCNAVSLHIRRGDYLSNSDAAKIYYQCDMEYYRRAINYLKENTSKPRFFVFSDDIKWCIENLSDLGELHYVSYSGSSAQSDMFLMTKCKHHIIANSTFSWWGAWLGHNSDAIVVAPKKWFKSKFSSRDLIAEKWIEL
ncbi:alpha-1,2-fucosyltransferase [Pectobacterium parmentieri]|uniref:alpha-1,2-fucosyltransferase n=1 Tax=Pectobacterium parmentieri TaxID=1905730 RepID=UPI0009DEA631|nr:alpha-1,2-fucosyltransferase [Pectobacterium parmentieri]AYH06446.1 alpha-1,2-fucosyltransferase [Pectobacterium parmentieri]AYH23963.1 alpha-1,2-fucosyltransferase [Pectobacterium parmentieri]MBN3176811.1 alpha-1,2-fucosyltransferase [Pectobacterium parmentieri]